MMSSGKVLVVVIVAAALVFGAGTWWQYTTDNPTSTDASLVHRDGAWVVEAQFAADDLPNVKVETRAVISSPDFPGLKMTGQVSEVTPDEPVVIALQQGPPEDAFKEAAPAAVTLDAVTAPQ